MAYGGGDAKLRVGQLTDALLRNARYVVGIEMHAGHMRYGEAIRFWRKMGAAFTLQGFHDAFLRQGFPPIPLIRQALLQK